MELPSSLSFMIWDLISALGCLFGLLLVLPSFAVVALVTLVSFVRRLARAVLTVQGLSCRKFLRLSQPLKRLESETRAPIQSALSEALAGLVTLRAFGHTGRSLAAMLDLTSDHCRPAWVLAYASTWVSTRIYLECVTATCVNDASLALIARSLLVSIYVCLNRRIDPALAGLAVIMSSDVAWRAYWTVMHLAGVSLWCVAHAPVALTPQCRVARARPRVHRAA